MSENQSARTERISADLAEVLAPLDLVVEDVSVIPAGKRRLVRVLVDRDIPAGSDPTATVRPLDLDQVASATRVVSDRLDDSEAMGEQAYVLEVSSPGTDRPLTEPRHFRRNVRRLIELSVSGADPVTGRIIRADESGFTLEVTGAKGATAEQTFSYDDGLHGSVQVEFNRGSDSEGDDH